MMCMHLAAAGRMSDPQAATVPQQHATDAGDGFRGRGFRGRTLQVSPLVQARLGRWQAVFTPYFQPRQFEEYSMPATNNSLCQCPDCPGSGCHCGCQNQQAFSANAAACACGTSCRCGEACNCKTTPQG
jgi:hypothetical protein